MGQQDERGRNLDPANRDLDVEKKRQSMLERLSARHRTRLDNSNSCGTDTFHSSESNSSFLSRFSDSKRSIDSLLSESQLRSASDLDIVRSRLADISSSISDLEKLVAESSYFLPSYEVRSSLKIIDDCKQSLEVLTAELLPRRKFSFRHRASENKPPLKVETSDPVSTNIFNIRESPGFRHEANKNLVKKFNGKDNGEFTLSDLYSCEVRLIGGEVNAIFMNRLKNCKVYAGPARGSILIEGAEDCLFVLASHQIRIHMAKKSDFYLRVRSRPIIEDSEGVRFAPYCLEYEGIGAELAAAGLAEETGNWGNVDDFKWLRAIQSPNWCLLPDNERIGTVSFVEYGQREEAS